MSDPEQPPLRAGVVGLGMMGRNHVRVWDESVGPSRARLRGSGADVR